MLPSEVLLAARELVAGGWTKGAYARTATGNPTSTASRKAVCFCSLGAISIASPGEPDYDSALGFFRKATPMYGVAHFNDAIERTHLEVVLAFERAALLAMKERA